MTEVQPVTIQISRNEAMHHDTSLVVDILSSFVPALCDRNRNRVQFEVTGYAQDSRELYDVPEVRAYFQHLFQSYPGLFYWIDFRSYMYGFMALMLGTPIRGSGGVTVSSADITAYLSRGFMGLNTFCAEQSISPEPTNKLIKEVILASTANV